VPRRDPVRQALEKLKAHSGEAHSTAAQEAFAGALRRGAAPLAACAARLVAEHEVQALRGELETSFQRFLRDGARVDRGCLAKLAIVEALDRLGHERLEPFRTGMRLIQLEASYGGRVDTAAALRGRCALALSRAGDPGIYRDLSALLFDPWPETRALAVSAAALAGGVEAELLLRAKLHAGHEEPAILGDCLRALLKLDPDAGFGLATERLLGADEELAAQAALALGESHHPRAFEALQQGWETAIGNTGRRELLLLPIALVRSAAAREFLAEVEREGPSRLAAAARGALRGVGGEAGP
jgi:hypothetical protein